MFLNNYQHLKKNETYLLILLILFSFFIRIPIVLLFGDTGLENEWKMYGKLMELPWICMENVWKMHGKFMDVYGQCLENVW